MIEYWRNTGPIGVDPLDPAKHTFVTERTLLFTGERWTRDDGVEMVGPLDWKVLPQRGGPPDWVMPLADLRTAAVNWEDDGFDDELLGAD